MRTSTPVGTLFSTSSSETIDDWSREAFQALSAWAQAHDGTWTRYEPGYLLLELRSVAGQEIDPILIDTANEELTVEFGCWEMTLPEDAIDADGAAREALALVSHWLRGEVKTAVFRNGAGGWCGTRLIQADAPLPPEPGSGIAYHNPTHVEVRSPRQSDWRTFHL